MDLLLRSIAKKCNCENVEIELVDLNGEVKQVNEFKSQYAHHFLKDREILILVKIDSKHFISYA